MMTRKTFTLIIFFISFASLSFSQPAAGDKTNVSKILNYYLDIKNALVKNDGTTAKIKANKLYYLLSTDPDKGMTNKQARVLADALEPLLHNTKGIGETVFEDEQRHYFAQLTLGVYGLLKGTKISYPKLYLQYSPLNNAYWLSETQVIKNPYYNYKDWATTGKTTEVLAAR